jgi:hypothetical protein
VKGGRKELKLRRKTRYSKDKQVKDGKQSRKFVKYEEREKGIR